MGVPLEAPFVQKVEIISAKEPRRRWSEEEKRRLVAEAFAPGAVTSHVARLHVVATSCLFAWRKRFAASANGVGAGSTAAARHAGTGAGVASCCYHLARWVAPRGAGW